MKELDIIRAIAAESSKSGKEKLAKELLSTDDGRWIVQQAYNPFITYGLTPPPPDKIEGAGTVSFKRALVEPLLNKLHTRELSGHGSAREVNDVMAFLDEDGRDLLYRILSKDLKCGASGNTFDRVEPGILPIFKVMRAESYEPRHIKSWPVKGEFKLDGQRNTFVCRNGVGGFFTRSGKRVDALDFFVPTLIELSRKVVELDEDLAHVLWNDADVPDFVLDGEAMMGLFEETGALRRKNAQATSSELHLYDIMPVSDFENSNAKGAVAWQRRNALERFVRASKKILAGTERANMVQIVPQYFLNSEEDIADFFQLARSKTLASYLARGNAEREQELLKTTIDKATGAPKVLEGVMIKDMDALYEKRKSRGWLKLKAQETEDLVVIGAEPGKVGTKYADCLGALIVDRNSVEVRVGGGFTDEERRALWKDFEHDKARESEGVQSGPLNRRLLGRMIEVEFHEVTPDGSLRHPRFLRFRDDKQGEAA